jgi:hypothetical protein
MKKKTMLVISLILSVLSLLYFVAEYYGGTRYIKLHNNSADSYLQTYSAMDKGSNNRIVVCFHTDSEGLKTIDPFLNSILDQSVRVDDIMLVIDHSKIDNVEEKYKKIVSVHGFKKNYDNNAALIMSILTEPDANTKIILVDPQIIYPVDFIETMISESDKQPNNIIYGSDNRTLKYGILVKPLFFDDKISKYECGSTSSCSDCIDKYSDTPSSVADCGNFYRSYNKFKIL